MNANTPDPELTADMARYELYLAGTVAEAWQAVLSLWQRLGRVNDFPRGIRKPGHSACFESKLGLLFIKRFAGDHEFILGRLSTGSPLEASCAFDLLDSRTSGFRVILSQRSCARAPYRSPRTFRRRSPPIGFTGTIILTQLELLEFEANGQALANT